MPTKYWVVLNISAHPAHPVSHTDNITLKAYFDENPSDTSDHIVEVGRFYAVPSEHATRLPDASGGTVYHAISADEYRARAFNYHIWAEPYGIAALASPYFHNNLCVGRVRLISGSWKHKGSASGLQSRPAAIKPDDMVIEFDVQIADSVVQFAVNEMNNNQNDPRIETIQYLNQESDDFIAMDDGQLLDPMKNSGGHDNYTDIGLDSRDEADYRFGHIVHADPHPDHGWFQRQTQRFQEWFFEGGGEWDHKPRIYPYWGSMNRLGNRGHVYRYDIWSNIHYGFMGAHAGFGLQHLIEQASVAQVLDNITGSDDIKDQTATEEGFNLYLRSRHVTIQDLVNIAQRHPEWLLLT
ncbi:polymorphic toxin type 44 domain-containing protein [Halocynthiibacter namhaensis]|uniref:polymorphic toxin type 44 domain-containing protein n=1 Tax=Halocynthiibacter namhaensis TaxID=1290553 RepID=UPI0005796AA6|nr:polymorphic toxin type 44 domain-containing protein [Halocynthiibacter namhaensis]